MLGTVDAPDGRQLTVADVPGLIEGASQGVGLGHEFLAHLERARLLVHVIDAAAGDPAEQFRQIDHELAEYGAGLDERRQVVVLNKVDLLPEPPELGVEDERIVAVFAVSAATGRRHRRLQAAAVRALPAGARRREIDPEALADFLVYRPQPRGAGIQDPAHRSRLPRPRARRRRPRSSRRRFGPRARAGAARSRSATRRW